MGKEWRDLIGKELRAAGLQPRVVVDAPFVESLIWRNGDKYLLAVVSNEETEASTEARQIRVAFALRAKSVQNARSRKTFTSALFTDDFMPWGANLYSFILPK